MSLGAVTKHLFNPIAKYTDADRKKGSGIFSEQERLRGSRGLDGRPENFHTHYHFVCRK